ncbi:MAG: hypothetical protein A3I66_13855 [Burkholderiales bacterium RIFCSPLOWO2_02_FULL_57_36]|nr:MAG: hypothetical protein A3I66_13855 [Burkholderiales bacterium RIFCSPLOWO2_02_FULL_57_36]
MKIQIASDLHLEFLEKPFPGYRVIEPANADVLVIAGDIHRTTEAIAAFADWPVPVIYVHGNHEAYFEQYSDLVENMRAASAGSQVHYLEKDEYVLHGVRFLGCCLWTDYRLYPDDPLAAMTEAEAKLRDHDAIRTERGYFTAQDALDIHRESRAWLEMKLDQAFDGPTVVVTHHGPHPDSIHPRFAGMILNAAFVSDLTPLMGQADLWIHGHVHDSFDYEVSGTRIIANPRGYPLNRLSAQSIERIEWENSRFDPQLVVRVGSD